MSRRIALALGGAMLFLAACNRGPEVHEENASVDEVAAKVREATKDGQFIRAGEWKSVATIEDVSIAGMPEAQKEQVKAAMARQATHETTVCLSEEDVRQPKGTFFTGNDQCRYDSFNMKRGKIDATMRCTPADGPAQTMTMSGTYSPESYVMRMEMRGDAQGGPMAGMVMRMKMEARRTGVCTAGSTTAD